MDTNMSKLWEIVKDRKAWHAAVNSMLQRVGHDLVTEQQQTSTDIPVLLSIKPMTYQLHQSLKLQSHLTSAPSP